MLWSIAGWALIALGVIGGVSSLLEPIRGKTASEWFSGIAAGLLLSGVGWLLLPASTPARPVAASALASATSEPILDPDKPIKYYFKKGSLIATSRQDMETCFQHLMHNDEDAIKDMMKNGKILQIQAENVRVFITQYDNELAGHGYTKVKAVGASAEVWCVGDSLERRN